MTVRIYGFPGLVSRPSSHYNRPSSYTNREGTVLGSFGIGSELRAGDTGFDSHDRDVAGRAPEALSWPRA